MPIALTKRQRIWVAIGGVFLVALVGFGLHRFVQREFRWSQFLALFRTLDAYWFAMAGGLMFLTYAVRAFRWRLMIRPMRPNATVWPIISATCIGFTAITLFGRPGEIVRPYLIAAREKLPFSSQIAAWLLERIYDLLMVLVIFGYALTRLSPERGGLGPALEWALRTGGYVAALIGGLCVVILVAVSQFSEKSKQRLNDSLGFLPDGARHKAEALVHSFTSGMSCSRGGRQVLQLLAWSVTEWFLIAASTLCLFRSFPVTQTYGWIEALVFLGFVAFGSIVQIPGIGGGLQVAGVVVLTRVFGLDFESATGISILFWFIGFVLVLPVGFLLMVREGVKLKSLRNISEEEMSEAAEVASAAPQL